MDLKCWRTHSVTATIPGVTDCDGRSKHRIVGVVKRPLNKMTLEENKIRQIIWYPVSRSQVQNPQTSPGETPGQGRWCTFIGEPGFYELVFNSKLEFAKRFRDWVFTTVLPSIRKYGQYKLLIVLGIR